MARIELPTRLIVIGAGIVLGGCSANVGPRSDSVERAARVQALENEIAALRIRLEDADRSLAALERDDHDLVADGFLPRPAEVVSAAGSAVRTGATGGRMTWRLRTEDSRARFVQVVGPATVAAVALDADGGAVELGSWTVNPSTWRNALREGLMGTAYSLDLPLESPVPDGAQVVLARVEVFDPRLEQPLRLESEIPVLPDRGRSR